MKTNARIKIEREEKTIFIYLNNCDWSNVPDLSFIADVEVYNQPERSKREDLCKKCDHMWQMATNDKDICMRCGALNSMET